MSDQKTVLLLPGPDSAASAVLFFGENYEYVSYLTENYNVDTAAYITNGKLKPFAGRSVLLWQAPPRGRSESLKAGPESVLRELLKLECTVNVIAFTEDDEQYEPMAAHAIQMPPAELIAWAKKHKKPVDVPPVEHSDVPRETKPVKRGRPRSRPDGAPPAGTQIGGNESAFVLWRQLGLDCNQNDIPYPHLANVRRILAGHPDIAGKIWYDEFHNRIFTTLFSESPSEWNDIFDTDLCAEIITRFRMPRLGIQIVQRAVSAYAASNIRNEPREWVDSLCWDRRERLATVFSDAFGSPQDDYHAGIGRCWFVSMVARIYEPGCKVDYMPVFEGIQGKSKTSALEVIGGQWFAELHEDINKKDFFLALQGKLLVEFTELHQFTRSDIERIKGIITCRQDRYRIPFERHTADHPRQCVFAGTTNRDDWVTDDTGARRFWPVACGDINLDYLRANREQLFAEASYLYNKAPRGSSSFVRLTAGAAWWDIDFEAAKIEQDARRDLDPWFDPIADWLGGRERVTVTDILEFGLKLPLSMQDMGTNKRIGAVLRLLGYRKRVNRMDGVSRKVWMKG